jgi:hypothetical protein
MYFHSIALNKTLAFLVCQKRSKNSFSRSYFALDNDLADYWDLAQNWSIDWLGKLLEK